MREALWRPVTSFGEDISKAIAADPRHSLLVFDFDGTLADIVPNPADAKLHVLAAEALGDLGEQAGQLAIITGRDARTVVGLAGFSSRRGLGRLKVFGLYGAERWDARTGEFDIPSAPPTVAATKQEVLDYLREAEQLGHDLTGIFVEDKEGSIGVHYRNCPDPAVVASWLLPALTETAKRHGMHEEPGKMIVELRASSVTKGDALRRLIEEVNPRVLIMAGDDLGDIPAFEACWAAREQGLITANIVSASEEANEVQSYADIWCAGPSGIASWLEHLNGLIAARA